MKNINLITRYWHGGARAIVVEQDIAKYDGYPVVIKFGEYGKPCHPCFAAIAVVGPDNGGYDRVLATDAGLGRLRAKVKKMTQPAAAPSPVPAPAPKPARLPAHPPNVAEMVGMSKSTLEKWVDLLESLERQRREAQALAVANRKAAQVWRQHLVAAGRVVPAQETA